MNYKTTPLPFTAFAQIKGNASRVSWLVDLIRLRCPRDAIGCVPRIEIAYSLVLLSKRAKITVLHFRQKAIVDYRANTFSLIDRTVLPTARSWSLQVRHPDIACSEIMSYDSGKINFFWHCCACHGIGTNIRLIK